MKNVLLPTDLTLQSLYPVHEICNKSGADKCNIYIIHTLDMPTGIMDLLFLQEKKPYKAVSPQFMEALELLRRKYSFVINILSFEFVWGSSRAFLRNYMQGRDIESVYMLKEYDYKRGLLQSVNCVMTLKKCKIPISYVQKAHKEEFGRLTSLLYREEKMPA